MNYCPYCNIGIDYIQMKERHCNNCSRTWDNFHVYPNNDLKEHNTSSFDCDCNPEIKPQEGNMIIVHNSYDGREGLEWVNEILKITNHGK